MRRAIGIMLAAALGLTGCGGGGGGGASSGTPAGGEAPGPGGGTQPAFAGFDFMPQAGDFWEYVWDYRYVDSSSVLPAPSQFAHGHFRVTLGPPESIGGVTGFPLAFSGTLPPRQPRTLGGRTGSVVMEPQRFSHLAFADNQVLGSADGTRFVVLFDARNGERPGTRFFASHALPSYALAEGPVADHPYLFGSAVEGGMTWDDSTSGGCEIILGQTVCTDSRLLVGRDVEFYRPGIGVVGFQRLGQDDLESMHVELGILYSSVEGRRDFVMEQEPNDSGVQAQTATLGAPSATVVGDARVGDPATARLVTVVPDGGSQVTLSASLEDWYTFTLPTRTTVAITLSVDDTSNSADLDLFLFRSTEAGLIQQAYSIRDNTALHVPPTEAIRATLDAGTYTLAVDAFATPNGRVPYVLKVEAP